MDKVIGSYNPNWISMFQTISNYLKQNLKTYNRIEHIGSTAIPGMDAKPIIDIDIEIASKTDFNAIKNELEKIGYTHIGDQGINGREAFIREKGKNTVLDNIAHHLYVCTSDTPEYQRHILFRDKLRSNKRLMEAYRAIKHEIIQKVGNYNRKAYVEMKENNYKDFFERVLNEKR